MNPKEYLDMNGSFHESPLVGTLRKLHTILDRQDIPYAVIGGMAVIRCGGHRTTHDIDILIRREDWERVKTSNPQEFECGIDTAVDTRNGIPVNVLFSDDDWDMLFLLPDPASVGEYDESFGAYFMRLDHLLELKTAVYLQKLKDDGIEFAAKDLADVVELIRNNRGKITPATIDSLHPGVRQELLHIRQRVITREQQR
jgi:hypothetical protein